MIKSLFTGLDDALLAVMGLNSSTLSRPALIALLASGLLAFGAPAQATPGSLRDFRLPPDPNAASEEPAPQGPVVPDIPASTEVLRQSETPTPTPAPSATATATPIIQPLPPITPRTTAPAVTPPLPTPRGNSASEVVTSPAPDLRADAEVEAPPEETAAGAPSVAPPTQVYTEPTEAEAAAPSGGVSWLWIGLGLLIVAIAAALWILRRRSRASDTVPVIERPTIPPTPTPTPAPALAQSRPASQAEPALPQAAGSELEWDIEPQRLSLTLMNAALSYRLLVTNAGSEPLENLTITADMIGAHAALSREEQLSGPDANAMQVACIDLLRPGEKRSISADLRLPFTQIVPVRQGNAALLFPLVRLRIEAAGKPALTRTYLVAQPPEQPGAGLRPFRLDLGPRVYPNLARQLLR